MSLAWSIAALQRSKKMPTLKKLMARDPAMRRRQTPEEQWAIYVAMAEAQKMVRIN